jgi:hypothetical protein
MKVNILKNNSAGKYMMVTVNVEEAASLISSLSNQIKNHDSNSNREETKTDNDGDFVGYFSICVHPDHYCIKCNEEIGMDPCKLEKGGFLCKKHLTHRESHIKKQKRVLHKK